MKKKKDDFDLDIDDLVSASESSKKKKSTSYYEEILLQEEEEEDSDSFEAVVRRLEKATLGKTWISVPCYGENDHYIGEYGKELTECTGEEFMSWLNHIYPAAKTMKHSPADYKSKSSKESAFIEIVTILRNFQNKFGIDMTKAALG